MDDKYICNDDGILEELREIRQMSDEEFERYINTLRKSEEMEAKNPQ